MTRPRREWRISPQAWSWIYLALLVAMVAAPILNPLGWIAAKSPEVVGRCR